MALQTTFLKGGRSVLLEAILRQSQNGHSRKNIRQRILAGEGEFYPISPISGLSLPRVVRKVTGFGGTGFVDGEYRTDGE
jgi:hypothetical protein